MIKLSPLFWLALVVVMGVVTYKVKYSVQDLEDNLAKVRKQTVSKEEEIRVLHAEWTYLDQPERLADLNQRYLGLVPISTTQLSRSIADITLRPEPTPPAPSAAAADAGAAPSTVALDSVPPAVAAMLPVAADPAAPAADPPAHSLDALFEQVAASPR
jgi:hypothetical protein